jgi:hypothetical protein
MDYSLTQIGELEELTDGNIYRNIRECHFKLDFPREERWWACLRGQRAKRLKTLLRNKEVTAAFDALLDIPGL